MNNGDLKEHIRVALTDMPNKNFLSATRDLLNVLGYQSERIMELSGDPEDFIRQFPVLNENTSTVQTFRKQVQSIQIVFQMTNDEIVSANQQTLGLKGTFFQERWQDSIIFFAVELKEENYAQEIYDEFAREIDKRIIVPTMVFFRAGARLTVAVIDRRPHKPNGRRGILECVTSLSKNIPLENPRRTDIDILSQLSLPECVEWMDSNAKPHNCEGLLAAWLAKLDTTEHNQKFYRYMFDWFEQMVSVYKISEGEENNLRLYFNDIAKFPLLSREREAELSVRIHKGDMRAREEMIQANLRSVINEAKRYQNRGLPLSDLISAGNLGLITATDRFDGTRGNKFIVYAVWWIRQSIRHTLATQTRTVRLPANKVSLLWAISKASRKLGQDSVSNPIGKIAAELEVPVKEIRETLLSNFAVYSLDEFLTNDKRNLIDTVTDDTTTTPPDADILHKSALIQLEATLELLKERESRIIKLYFGLGGNEALTLQEIGTMMNLSRERIRQIKNQALKKLRRHRMCHQALKTLTTWPVKINY